jgi:hypothetical protein
VAKKIYLCAKIMTTTTEPHLLSSCKVLDSQITILTRSRSGPQIIQKNSLFVDIGVFHQKDTSFKTTVTMIKTQDLLQEIWETRVACL